MIWTRPKQIKPVKNNWYSTKIIWTVQNHFGPIEGQGINVLQNNLNEGPESQVINQNQLKL